MGKRIRNDACPKCSKSDMGNSLGVYEDSVYCFECEYWAPIDEYDPPLAQTELTRQEPNKSGFTPSIGQLHYPEVLKGRGISRKILEKFTYHVGEYTGYFDKEYLTCEPAHIADIHDRSGKKLCSQVRFSNKRFKFIGDTTSGLGLVGTHLYQPNPNMFATIVEGYIDQLSVAEACGSQFAVVTVPAGAASAKRAIQKDLDWLQGFKYVVLALDNDEAGKKAMKEAAELFSPGKVRIATWPDKDPNQMLTTGRRDEIKQTLFNAVEVRPEGIVNAHELWDLVKEPESKSSVTYPWEAINEYTKGIRPYELVTLAAGTGTGKSTMVKEMISHLLKTTDHNIGVLSLEESVRHTVDGLMAIEANKPLHEFKQTDKEDKRKYFDATVGSGRVFLYDHFGSVDETTLTSMIHYMAKAQDCKWVFLDHISIAISGLKGDNERQLIDRLMTQLRSIVQETGIGLFVVSHLRRLQSDSSHERGAYVDLNQLRGSHAIAQISDIVIGLERNQQADSEVERDLVSVRVIKNRYSGDNGPAGILRFDKSTGRLLATRAVI